MRSDGSSGLYAIVVEMHELAASNSTARAVNRLIETYYQRSGAFRALVVAPAETAAHKRPSMRLSSFLQKT